MARHGQGDTGAVALHGMAFRQACYGPAQRKAGTCLHARHGGAQPVAPSGGVQVQVSCEVGEGCTSGRQGRRESFAFCRWAAIQLYKGGGRVVRSHASMRFRENPGESARASHPKVQTRAGWLLSLAARSWACSQPSATMQQCQKSFCPEGASPRAQCDPWTLGQRTWQALLPQHLASQ